jgi:membrane-associated protein
VVSRYIPGGRTAVTLTTGAIGFPLRLFTAYDALAGLSWAAYCALVGYIGGTAFEENPLYGVVLGIALAMALAGLLEVGRAVAARRARPTSTSVPAVETLPGQRAASNWAASTAGADTRLGPYQVR